MQIFQSTLPRGERPSAERLGGVLWDFNPRSHEGSDLLWSGYRTKLRDISIHAPTRGATSISSVTDPVFIISIHAPTRGATPCRQKKSSMQIFQSTLPRGERPSAERLGGVLWDFNPRSHEGSDLLWSGYRTKLRDISIHAPTRGATSISSVTDHVFIISIHAPTRGATALPCL